MSRVVDDSSSAQRFERVMQSSNAGFWDWDVLNDEFYASPRLLEMEGFAPGTTFSGREDFMRRAPFHPEDREKWQQAVKQLFASGGARVGIEVRAIVRGETTWRALYGMCFRDADGKVVRWSGSSTDITERKRAEALLAGEKDLLELMARAMPLPQVLNALCHIVEVNIPGCPCSILLVDASGKRLEHGALALSHELHSCWSTPILSSAKVVIGTFAVYLPHASQPNDAQRGVIERFTHLAAVAIERSRSEEELRRRQEMLEVAQRSARAVPWEWRNGVAPASQRWSPELEAMMGYAPGAYDGSFAGWRKIVHPDDWGRVKSGITLALATGDIDIEYRIVHASGDVRWVNQKGRTYFDGSGAPLRSIGFQFDVTDRHKVEDDLRSRQEMLDLAQKSARAIAFEWKIGAEGENRWSPDLEAMYGAVPGTYDGSFDAWKKLVHREDWPAVKEAIKQAMATGDVASEYRVVHADGSVHWLLAKGRMFFDDAGKATRLVGFMQDITQRKRAEEELQKMEQELRRAQRLEAIGTLAGGIAHDFNNILGAILGYGEMALRSVKKDTQRWRDIQAMISAGERGRALVDRILAFSRSGLGERVPVHVEEVVQEALNQIIANLPANINVVRHLRAGRAAMLGDSTQVHQVVTNLTTNAVQAMPDGGVLRTELEVARMEAARAALIGSVSPGEYLVLSVRDTGIGIGEAVLECMFDPFFTTKEVGVGTGLGLSLVHGIVTNVGGAIDVATELGKGTTFTVYLPRTGDAPERTVDRSRRLPRGLGQRVLVVDDEEPLVHLATKTLERLGYAPSGFTSSVAALAAFREDPQRFDVVLTDERMPELSGSALIREVRGLRDSIPIVLMSGYLGVDPSAATIVLKKPLSARELATSMARALRDGHP